MLATCSLLSCNEMQEWGPLKATTCRRDLHYDVNRRLPHLQEQHTQQRVGKIAYWLLAAFCICSALLVSIYVSGRTAEYFS